MGICPTSYFHILAVRMSKPDTFKGGIRGPFAKLKALSISVISYLIGRPVKDNTVLISNLIAVKNILSYFTITKDFGVTKFLSERIIK